MATFLTDNFTDTAGTNLTAHTSDSGATWSKVSGFTDDLVITNANRARPVAGDGFYIASATPGGANYYVETVIRCVSNPGSGYLGIMARATASDEGYWAIYNEGTGAWELRDKTATTIGSNVPQSLTVGNDYTLRLTVQGTAISVSVGGSTIITGTSSASTAAGKAGVIGSGAYTNSVGIHLDSVVAIDIPTLHIAGDSIAAGNNASDAAHQWGSLLTASLSGYAQSNTGISSTQIADQTTDDRNANRNQIYQSFLTTDIWAWLSGYNDMRFFGTDANGLESYRRSLRSAIAWISRANSDCYQGQNGAWTLSGGWSNANNCGLLATTSATNGDTASISLTGTAITLSYLAWYNGAIATGGAFQVKIDGVVVAASIDSNFGSQSGYNPGGAGLTRYAPMAMRWSGLSAGAHTLLITKLDTNNVQLNFACGNGEAATPEVRVGGPLKMNGTGYAAGSPYNVGSDAAVAAYENAIKNVLQDATTDGRNVKWADVNSYYTVAHVDTDNVHPVDAGHADIYNAFNAAAAFTNITFDGASNSGDVAAASSYSGSASWDGTNRLLAVDVSMLGAGVTVTAMTYGGANCTFIGAQSTVTSFGRVEQWRICSSDSGAPGPGSNTLAVTLSGSLEFAVEWASYTGVKQAAPTEAFNSAQATNVGAADASVAVTSVADNCWIHAAVAVNDTSITANQASRNNTSGTLGSGANEDNGLAVTPAGATTMSYTGVAGLKTWAISGYAIRPISASGPAFFPAFNKRLNQAVNRASTY